MAIFLMALMRVGNDYTKLRAQIFCCRNAVENIASCSSVQEHIVANLDGFGNVPYSLCGGEF